MNSSFTLLSSRLLGSCSRLRQGYGVARRSATREGGRFGSNFCVQTSEYVVVRSVRLQPDLTNREAR